MDNGNDNCAEQQPDMMQEVRAYSPAKVRGVLRRSYWTHILQNPRRHVQCKMYRCVVIIRVAALFH